MNDLTRREFSSLSSSPNLNWAEETWQGVFQGPGHRGVSDDCWSQEIPNLHLSLPWPVRPFQHQLLGHPPYANACGTQVQAAGQGAPL